MANDITIDIKQEINSLMFLHNEFNEHQDAGKNT